MKFGWIVVGVIFCVIFFPVWVDTPIIPMAFSMICSVVDIVFFILGIIMIIYGATAEDKGNGININIDNTRHHSGSRQYSERCYCPYCGVSIMASVRYCPACGNKSHGR